MSGFKESISDIYACAVMIDLEGFKERIKNERRSEIAKNIEPVRHFLPE